MNLLRLFAVGYILSTVAGATAQDWRGGLYAEPYVRSVDPDSKRRAAAEQNVDNPSKSTHFSTFEKRAAVERARTTLGVELVGRQATDSLVSSHFCRRTSYGLDLDGAILSTPIHVFELTEALYRLEDRTGFWRNSQGGSVLYAKGVRCAVRIVGLNFLGITQYWASDQKSRNYFANSVTLQLFGSVNQPLIPLGLRPSATQGALLVTIAATMLGHYRSIVGPESGSRFEAMEILSKPTLRLPMAAFAQLTFARNSWPYSGTPFLFPPSPFN